MHDTLSKPNPFLRNATKFFPFRRKRSSPSIITQEAPSPTPNPQWQTLFFTTLPPELRILIYHELARDAPSVVHVVKKTKKRIGLVLCKGGKCEMEYNYKCQPNSSGRGAQDRISLLPFLLSCRKGNIEANPVLYTATTFDFRSFPAYLLASTILPPHTFSYICSVHLKYHFGYRLWCGHPDNYYTRPREDPVWNQVWEIMKGMEELRSVVVDLDAYLEDGRVGSEMEREVLRGLGAVRIRGGGAGGFVVRVTWEGGGGEGAEEESGKGTFRLVRIGRASGKVASGEVDVLG